MEGLGIVEPPECDGALPTRYLGDLNKDLVIRAKSAFDKSSPRLTTHDHLTSEGVPVTQHSGDADVHPR